MAGLLDTKITLTPELRQAATRIGLVVLALIVSLYALVVRPFREGRALDAEIAASKAEVAKAKTFSPVLESLMRDEHNASLVALRPPKSSPVPRMSVYLMPQEVGRIAKDAGVDALNITLDPASLAQDPNAIRLSGVFSGPFGKCRALLTALGALPGLARLEHVEMRAVDGHIEMMVQLRIALTD